MSLSSQSPKRFRTSRPKPIWSSTYWFCGSASSCCFALGESTAFNFANDWQNIAGSTSQRSSACRAHDANSMSAASSTTRFIGLTLIPPHDGASHRVSRAAHPIAIESNLRRNSHLAALQDVQIRASSARYQLRWADKHFAGRRAGVRGAAGKRCASWRRYDAIRLQRGGSSRSRCNSRGTSLERPLWSYSLKTPVGRSWPITALWERVDAWSAGRIWSKGRCSTPYGSCAPEPQVPRITPGPRPLRCLP